MTVTFIETDDVLELPDFYIDCGISLPDTGEVFIFKKGTIHQIIARKPTKEELKRSLNLAINSDL